ncbi:MAG: ATP-binding cassette domain-containing protein [Bacteriovorax sp.]|nr:ATP-binding cassette domain-containing protein [Rhizobacter sp.]
MSARDAPMSDVLLDVQDVVKHYRLPRESLFRPAPLVQAVRGVSLQVQAGRSLGLVGESGSGKSTLARLVMALEAPTAGSVRLLGRDLNALPAAALRAARRDFQMVFQDPYGSLDPRQRVARIVAEPLVNVSTADMRQRVAEALDAVGLRASDADKYPHEFSGGQRQRIAIARALITRPRLIVADEPVSALDVSVQAQVLNLLADLQEQFGVTYLFISHDLAVVDHVCDEVAVMYAGRVVEQGTPDVLFQAAAHPYTRALMAALPQATVNPRRAAEPSRAAPPMSASGASARVATADKVVFPAASPGCSFADRCPHAQVRCERELPALRPLSTGHRAACHFAESVMTEVALPGDRP